MSPHGPPGEGLAPGAPIVAGVARERGVVHERRPDGSYSAVMEYGSARNGWMTFSVRTDELVGQLLGGRWLVKHWFGRVGCSDEDRAVARAAQLGEADPVELALVWQRAARLGSSGVDPLDVVAPATTEGVTRE